MAQPLLRFKAGRRKQQTLNRGSRTGSPSLRSTALIQGSNQVQINDGHFTVVGGDSHTHFHSYENRTTVTLESILRAIPNFRKIHQDTLSKATPGTGMWLLKSKKFSVWLDPNGDLKIFWGSGIPGAGKTILAALVIDMLEALARESGRRICVAYVYIRYNDQAQTSIRSILEIFVKQTVERYPEFLPAIHQVYGPHISDGTQPTESQLLALLQQLTQRVATTYVLDALDEAPTEIQLDLVKKLASLGCKIFITSRHLGAVEAQFTAAFRFPIIAQDVDIDLLIMQKLEKNANLQQLLGDLESLVRDEIVMSVKSKCGGMFLHASLQLDAICQCLSTYDVKETLEAFPSEIEDAYLQTWNRILDQHPRHISLAKTIMLWVLNARRSMTIEELRRAVATSLDTFTFDSARMVPEATLLSICRGLVIFEEESRLVRLVHYTARAPLGQLLTDSFPYPHSLLATICMTRLADCGFQNTSLDSKEALKQALDDDPLLAYAHEAWAFHAHLSPDVKASQLPKFVTDCHAFPALIHGTFNLLNPLHLVAFYKLPITFAGRYNHSDPNTRTIKGGYAPLALAYSQGDQAGVRAILSLPGVDVNTQDTAGWSALMYDASDRSIVELLLDHSEIAVNMVNGEGNSVLMLAALRGDNDLIELLLARHEIQVNARNPMGFTALMLAACNGHLRAVKLLLSHPDVKTNLLDQGGCHSAFMFAVSNGHEGIAELLVTHPDTQVNFVTKSGWSALLGAAFNGLGSTVRLLLAQTEISVNLVNEEGYSALIGAANQGQQDVVELLLACSQVQVNLVGVRGFSALMHAAANGRKGVVEVLLLHSEVEVNLLDNDGCSALMLAASNGQGSIVELLLSHPEVDANLIDKDGWSALMHAAGGGHEGVVKLFLSHSEIELNLVDRVGDSALMLAATRGHTPIVKALLVCPQVKVNLVDMSGWSALMASVSNGYESTASALLTRTDVNVNLLNVNKDSALTLAAARGHVGIVHLLLARPEVEVNHVDTNGCSALVSAALGGHNSTVELLLDRSNIAVNLQNKKGYSVLMCAACHCHESIFDLLVSRPETKVNLLDGDGCSTLLYASSEGLQTLVKLLLGHPDIDVNAANPHGTTPLLMAVQRGHTDVVKLLLNSPYINVNSIDGDGDTAVKMAAEDGYEEMVQMLLDAPGIDITVASKTDGHTAMSAALAKGHDGIVQLLQAFEARNGRPARDAPIVTEVIEGSVDSVQSGEDQAEGSDSDESEAFEDALDTL